MLGEGAGGVLVARGHEGQGPAGPAGCVVLQHVEGAGAGAEAALGQLVGARGELRGSGCCQASRAGLHCGELAEQEAGGAVHGRRQQRCQLINEHQTAQLGSSVASELKAM